VVEAGIYTPWEGPMSLPSMFMLRKFRSGRTHQLVMGFGDLAEVTRMT
jgi:hypothetical protein